MSDAGGKRVRYKGMYSVEEGRSRGGEGYNCVDDVNARFCIYCMYNVTM